MSKTEIEFKEVIRKALEVYARKSLELDDITDEVVLRVCRRHLEEKGSLPKRWRDYIQKQLSK